MGEAQGRLAQGMKMPLRILIVTFALFCLLVALWRGCTALGGFDDQPAPATRQLFSALGYAVIAGMALGGLIFGQLP
jgi:hypothetical protein